MLTEQQLLNKWNNNEHPVVSICTVTYNHQGYIAEAIESFLEQETNFPFEILIHDDASNDNTQKIIKEYEKNYPTIIKPIYQTINQKSIFKSGMNPRFNYPRAKGKYIATCDGDDYWTDPYKLQKQVDFLEENPEYVMSFHSVAVINSIPNINYQYPIPKKTTLELKDLALKHYIPTCSLIFKKNKMPNPIPNWFANLPMGDIPLELMIASKGLTKYFPESMGVYRKHEGGITNNKVQILKGRKAYIKLYGELRNNLSKRYWILFTFLILKNKIGFIRDWLGLNSLLR